MGVICAWNGDRLWLCFKSDASFGEKCLDPSDGLAFTSA